MDAIDCIWNRRSIRKFMQKPLEFDKVALILQAGSKAPSAGNLQDYRFIIVTDKDAIRGIAERCTEQYWIADAPVIIVVCSDTTMPESYYGLRGQRLYSVQDSAAAIQNMLLAANALGLGACWIGSFDEAYLADVLAIPEKVRPQAVIPIGYADGAPSEKVENPIEHLVYFNKYGSKIENLNTVVHEYNKEIEKIVKKTEPAVNSAIDTFRHKAKKFLQKTKEQLKNKEKQN